jgi:hypothetical protein
MHLLPVGCAIVASIGITACLPIPHYHLKRPAVVFEVRDGRGAAVPNARLAMYSGIVVGQSIRETAPVPLDSLGRGRLERDREWHWFTVFIPDAEAPWAWAWCADAPGYQRAAAGLREELRDTVRIRLEANPRAQRCLAAPQSLYDVDAEGLQGNH